MSRGGWICKQVTIRKGDFPVAEAASVYGAMCLFRDAILATGVWTLDPEIHTGTNAGVPILIDNYTNVWAHGLYFVDAGGAKLSVTYSWRSSPFPGWPSGVYYQTTEPGNNNAPAGLTISIIPPGCGSFDPTQVNSVNGYSPAYATPLVGLASCGNQHEESGQQSATNNVQGQSALHFMAAYGSDCGCTWSFVTKQNSHCLFVFVRNTVYGADRCGMIGAGRMLENLIHPSDSLIGTDYAWLKSGVYRSEFEDNQSGGGLNIRNDASDPFHIDANCDYGGFFIGMRQAAYSDENRTHAYNGMWKGPFKVFATPGHYVPSLADKETNDSTVLGKEEAFPIMVGWKTTTRRVVPGSGLKGFLDPEMILAIRKNRYQRGQTFDGGNYIHVGAGLLMPWDAELNQGVYLF